MSSVWLDNILKFFFFFYRTITRHVLPKIQVEMSSEIPAYTWGKKGKEEKRFSQVFQSFFSLSRFTSLPTSFSPSLIYFRSVDIVLWLAVCEAFYSIYGEWAQAAERMTSLCLCVGKFCEHIESYRVQTGKCYCKNFQCQGSRKWGRDLYAGE